MSENDEIDQKLEEKKNEYLKSKGVTINILGQKPKDSESGSEKSLEEQLEEERTLREDYESKLRLIAEQKLSEHAKKCRDLGFKGDLNTPAQVQSAEKHLGIYKDSDKGGSGSISLRGEDLQREKGHSGNMEFDSEAEMIDYLRSEAQKGNAEATEQLNQLWTKVLRGMREQPQKTLNFQIEEKDCLKKALDAQNRQWKKEKIPKKLLEEAEGES